MTTSRWPAVVDALVTACATTGVTVWDGPKANDQADLELIVVGGTDDPGDGAGEVEQEWAGLGAKAKTETGSVDCAVIIRAGDPDVVRTMRARAFVVFGQVETAIRADPTLGAVVSSGWLNVSAARPLQRQTEVGTYFRLGFTVNYQARI